MNHSYEEIRSLAIEILSEPSSNGWEYSVFKERIGQTFEQREGRPERTSGVTYQIVGATPGLSSSDANMVLEVFWGLFREGIVTLGINDLNREFPWFRVSGFGKKILDNQNLYFFHDVTTYERLITSRIPAIDPVTLLYLKEAMQAFKSGCTLSSSVMIGVATEHSFLKLVDTVENNSDHSTLFKKVYTERTILRRLNTFKSILDQNPSLLPSHVKEDLNTQFMSIITMIRNFRNESGHPSGKIIDREQCYILLQLFIPCCEKIYELIDVFT